MGLRLIALTCLVGAAFAGPFQRETGNRCATKCPQPTNPKFNYEPGKKYVYEYRGENFITVAGQQKQKARIEGIAEIHVITKCEAILKLKSVRLEQKLSAVELEDLRSKLELGVRFAWVDGQVEHICPSPEDSKHSLNIKKGLISAMVNTMDKLDTPQEVREYDSLGFCKTKYTVSYAHGLVVQKEKNLKSCTNRHSSITSLITNPYDSPESQIHTLPIFPHEKVVCRQTIEEQVIKSVQCKEFAKIKPLKERDSVIEFEGKIELRMLKKDAVDMLRMHEPKSQESLLYNLEEEHDSSDKEHEAEQILQQMCSKNSGTVDVAVSKDFIKLVAVTKTLQYNSLDRIQRALKSGRLCNNKKVSDLFVDTLPMAGSDAAVKLMVEMLERKEITGLKAKLWTASLALIANPNKHTVAAVLPLLKMTQTPSVILGVSAMVHRFCSRENCDSVSAVQQIVSVLHQLIGRRCSSNQEEKIFTALKAFGNMGYHGDAEQDILACAQDSSKPTRLRLAAIDAFRRSIQKRPQALLDLYINTEEDVEVRIAALSSAMKTADEEQLRQIKQVAENEVNDQVSGYSSTLIKNMRKTSSQLKKNIKQLLNEIQVNPRTVNYLENSKNIELSAFSEALNVGASIEADIVHSEESKIPRSLYSRFDLDVFDHNINFFEVGLRAEHLEKLIMNIVGIKDKIPKVPTWENLLSTKNMIGDTSADVSLFIRTMNTEIFDVAASDLTAVGEMVEIAEIMNKLARGKESDFSHSFLFMNSKLIIPSVTGRSYSIDLIGSATVGLTASTKMNLLSFPQHADVNLHLQPSVNVEVSTTVGILSNKQRPDIKLVSRMHMESHMAAKFQIKDGHVALASVSLPTENVVMTRLSSDVIEIDADHQESRVFDKMQKKIDYCFDKLRKPLGIEVCGSLEVPKPFVTKSFPFINGVGNLEFAIKKTDASFESYELALEIPKQSGGIMRYRASIDTPGSQISRRFATELEVKQRGHGHREFTLELTSPFKSAGGSGSYTWRHDLVQGSMELHSSSSRLMTANVSTEIAESRYRTIYKPSVLVSYKNREPLRVEGSVSVIKGRKQQISIDITSNKPNSKPVSVKGTIVKEGRFEISKTAEWKLSSDLAIQSPLADAQIRSTVEKESKHSQTYSSSLALDYQRRGLKKQSIKLTASTQKSSGKVSTNAQFETTQFPAASWALNWDMQRESRQNLKNDLTLKYGRLPETQYVNIKHRSRISESGRCESKVSVKVPQFNVDSELSVTHELEGGNVPKVYLEADLALRQDKHYKSLFTVEYESKMPLKAHSRAELEYPGGKLAYWDEIEETSRNQFEGKSSFQWREGKQVELKYKYQQLSDDYKLHHELETSLKVPSSHTPIKSKASVKLSEKTLSIEGQLNMNRNSEYLVQAHLNQQGVNHVSLKTPQVEGNLKISNKEAKKALDLDLKLKNRQSRRITASVMAELGRKKSFQAELLLDAERQPKQSVFMSLSLETRNGQTYSVQSQVQVLDFVSMSLRESGDISLTGSHELDLEASLKNYSPIKIEYQQQLSKGQAKSQLKFSQNQIQKVQFEMEGSLSNNRYEREIAARAAVLSLDQSFENMEISMSHKKSLSGSSTAMKSHLSFHRGSSKTYKAEWTSDIQANGLEMKAELNTPHENFENQALDIVFKKSSQGIESTISIQTSNKKVISLTTEMKKKSHGISTALNIKSPFRLARDVKAYLSFENQRNKKNIQTYLDVNSLRLADAQASMIKSSNGLETQGKLKITPIPNVQMQGLSFSYQRSSRSMEATLIAELENQQHISMTAEIKRESESISSSIQLSTPYKSLKDAKVHLLLENQQPKRSLLFYIDANEERKGDVEISVISSSRGIEVQGRLKTIHTPEISGHLKTEKRGDSLSLSAKLLKGSAPLFTTTLNKQVQQDSQVYRMKTESLEKTLLDIELSREVSNERMTQASLKVRGQFPPISVSIASSRNEQSSLSMEMSACRGSERSERQSCYNLKSSHKSLRNSEGYRQYKQLTIDLERSNEESAMEPMAKIHLFVSSSEHDYRSKVIIEIQEKKLGYEMRVHRREHENDHCSFDGHLFMPESTSWVKGSVVHNNERIHLELEALPNSAVSSRSYSLEYKNEHSAEERMSAFLKLSSPKMSKPILVTSQFEMEEGLPVRGKLEMHYSEQNKVLTLQVEAQSDEQRSLEYKLYREDNSLEASLKLMRKDSRQENIYAYEWRLKSNQVGQKKGGLRLKLSHKKNGRPQKIHISYYSPSNEIELHASAVQAPSDVSVSVTSKGKKIQEIIIKTSPSCVNFEVSRRGPLFRSALCLNKHERDSVQLVVINAHYRQNKILDIQVNLEPERPSYIDVILQWKKKDLLKALSELTGMDALFQNRSLKEIKQEIVDQLKQYKRVNITPALRKMKKEFKELKEEYLLKIRQILKIHSQKLRQHMISMKSYKNSVIAYIKTAIPWDLIESSVVKPLRQAFICFSEAFFQNVLKHVPQIGKVVWEMARDQMEQCLKKYCVEGTFCHEVFQTYQRQGLKKTKALLQKKISLAKQSLKQKFDWVQFDFARIFVRDSVMFFRETLNAFFGKLLGHRIFHRVFEYFRTLEQAFRTKAISYLDKFIEYFNQLLGEAEKDEDFRTAKSILSEAQRKLKRSWSNKKQIAEDTWKPIQENLVQRVQQALNSRVEVQRYSPKNGEISLKLRNPFGPAQTQIIRNELEAMKRKIQDSVSL
ncbi:hypothetical protein JTE90_007424 [Oedothorax gibbosus]|uniref:Vitellogenin domain-containing protein n=1 Tax=Oedothorax gibbosus TaxID=931172 RepID=A0AAV6UQX5_9ARAC|nr:hypothetical protein JTE90_007424 [Oedothorax gibbosus]